MKKYNIPVGDNCDSMDATEPPDSLWDESQETQPTNKNNEPLTQQQVIEIAHGQAEKWLTRGKTVSEDDFIDSKTAYRLLNDQARLFARLISRIQ